MKYTPLLNKKQNKLKHTPLKTKRSNTLNTVSSLKQTKSLTAKNIKLKKHNEKAKEKWDIVREKALLRDNNKCVACGKPATQVHHIHLRSKRKDLMYEINNLVSLCDKCHGHQSDENLEWVNMRIARAKGITLEELLRLAETITE